jgi:hypothetical protein
VLLGDLVTTMPPLQERANAATARSISAALRTLIGKTSTPSAGATDWITANWPIPAATIGAFSFHCNIWHRILELAASVSRPARRYDPRTRAESIRSIFRHSRSAKANLARWACHGRPWLLVGASRQRRRPDLDPGSDNAGRPGRSVTARARFRFLAMRTLSYPWLPCSIHDCCVLSSEPSGCDMDTSV